MVEEGTRVDLSILNCHEFQLFCLGSSAYGGGGYQSGPVDMNCQEFKAQKEDFFNRKQMENSMRRE
jgi:hypothetical protein